MKTFTKEKHANLSKLQYVPCVVCKGGQWASACKDLLIVSIMPETCWLWTSVPTVIFKMGPDPRIRITG